MSRPDKECSWCSAPARPGQAYCAEHHAQYVAKWRLTHPLSPEQRRRANARRTANLYQQRGKLLPKPCEVCGAPGVEKHHDDYAKPLAVRWLCAEHHRELHRRLK